MRDAVAARAEPADEVPPEFRVPEPEPVIAMCGAGRKSLAREHWFDVVVGVYAPTRLVVDLFTDHPLRAAFWAVVLCFPAWSVYGYGWKVPCRVELTRTTLRWYALFRRVEVPLLSVRAVYPAWAENKGRKLVVDGRGMPGVKVHVSALSVRRRL